MLSELNFNFIQTPLLTVLGLLIFVWRLIWKEKRKYNLPIKSNLEDLLIVIPCRNEAHNLPQLLTSLKEARADGVKIILVDDQSTDGTDKVAESYGIKVCKTVQRPEGWTGKNWACHQGYQFSLENEIDFKYVLFTDADTTHTQEGLEKALSWIQSQSAQLMTARPFHRNPTFWEQVLGPFYLLILFITNAKESHPKKNRFFSIGQFLLFQRAYYDSSGGHSCVRSELAEDLALAQRCFQSHLRFIVYPEASIYSTRMYNQPLEFYKGWQRNFRLGMSQTSYQTWIEVILVIGALLKIGNIGIYLIISALILRLQKQEGRFHYLGGLIFPLGVLIFIIISISAAIKTYLHKPILWKEREYLK